MLFRIPPVTHRQKDVTVGKINSLSATGVDGDDRISGMILIRYFQKPHRSPFAGDRIQHCVRHFFAEPVFCFAVSKVERLAGHEHFPGLGVPGWPEISRRHFVTIRLPGPLQRRNGFRPAPRLTIVPTDGLIDVVKVVSPRPSSLGHRRNEQRLGSRDESRPSLPPAPVFGTLNRGS